MKKHLYPFVVILLTTLVIFLSPLPLSAYDFQYGDLYYNITSNEEPYTVEVGDKGLSYYCYDTLLIPEIVVWNDVEYMVTSICDSAFIGCSKLSVVSIPSNIKRIGIDAFSGCYNIVKTNYAGTIAGWCQILFANPDSNPIACSHNLYLNDALVQDIMVCDIDSICDYAFYGCRSLSTVQFGYNGLKSIGKYAFANSGLCSVSVPASVSGVVEQIKEGAFDGCVNLNQFACPVSLNYIGAYAFRSCRNLTSFRIPPHTTYIGDYAFVSTGLTEVTIPYLVSHMGKACFADCDSLNSIVVAEDNPIYDSRNKCNAVIETNHNKLIAACKNTIVPSTTTAIEDYAFAALPIKDSVIIPNSVIEIGEWAYANIWGGKKDTSVLVIGKGLQRIGNGGFSRPSDTILKTIYLGTIEDWCHIDFADYGANPMANSHNLYINDAIIETLNIPETITHIKKYAFCGNHSLLSVSIPSSVDFIDSCAFGGCYGLTSIICKAVLPPLIEERYNPFTGVPRDIPLYVPAQSVDAYRTAEVWKEFNVSPLSETPTEIENITNTPLVNGQVGYYKMLRDGQVLILRDGKAYNLLGQEVR